jgi:hypothetical protein
MPAANPFAEYNTGYTSGMVAGTTTGGVQSPSSLTSGAGMAGDTSNANISCAALVGGALVVLILFHVLGFRFGFDVSVGR